MSWMLSQVLSKGTYTHNMSLRSQNSNHSNHRRKSKILGTSFFVLNNPVYFIKNSTFPLHKVFILKDLAEV